MIKICHVITDTNVGGAGKWLINLLKYIDRNIFDVIVVLPYRSDLIKLIEQQNVEVIELESMKNCSWDPKIINKLVKIFKERKINIVHTHASLSARIAGRIARVQCVIHTKHCLDIVDNNAIKRRIKIIINKLFSDKIIAISQAVKQNLIQQGINDKDIVLIYNGVEPFCKIDNKRKDNLLKKYNILEKDIVVGIVARLEKIKGHKYFIDAANTILKKYNNVKFLIVGDGSQQECLKHQVALLKIQDNVIFTGYIENVEEIMNIININVISSVQEALCLSLIEGMSIGIPCVGTDSGGVKEVIINNENGFVVPNKNSNMLAQYIVKLIDDKELRYKMGEQGIKIMNEKFHVEQMTKSIQKLYKNCLKGV